MQFEYTSPQTEIEKLFGGFFSINAFGKIERGDDASFISFLQKAQPPPRTTVNIDSSGGDVETAIAIGRLIRDSWFATSVGTYLLNHQDNKELIVSRELIPGKCLSAATIIFIGGRLRYLSDGSKFGVHQFSYRDPTPDNIGRSQVLSAKISRYVSEMGLPPEFLELSSSVPGTELKLLDEAQLKALRIVTGGQTDVSWGVQAIGGALYARGERDSLYGHHKVMLGHTKNEGFFFFALIESMGREEELLNFPLVDIVINEEEDYRIDVSSRCIRVVNGIYVNVMSNLTPEEAKMIAFSDGFGVQIRTSPAAEIFFGIAPMRTEGGRDQLETLYNMFC